MHSRVLVLGAAMLAASSSLAAPARHHEVSAKPAAAVAAVQDPACSVIAGQITDQLKNLSLLAAEETLETSAIRQSARESKKNGIMSAISINMGQMMARACKPFPYPVGDAVFKDAARVCVVADRVAQIKANTDAAWAAYKAGATHLPESDASHPPVAECDMSTWKPNV